MTNKFKHKLREMFVVAIERQESRKNRHYLDTAVLIQKSPQEWKNDDFETLSALTGISNSTLKRLFLPKKYDHHNFNKRTQESFCKLLGFEDWEDLQEALLESVLEDYKKELLKKLKISNFE